MRISDWSSDVCSSDLGLHRRPGEDGETGLPDCRTQGTSPAGPGATPGTAARPGNRRRHRDERASLLVFPRPWRRSGRTPADRKSVVWGKSVSVRVTLGVRVIIKKKKKTENNRP